MVKSKYGDKTAEALDNYMKDYKIPKWPDYLGPLAPATDFARNYAIMRTKNLDASDKFFHCKANYEASTRGKYGGAMAKELSDIREKIDKKVKGYPSSDIAQDQRANFRGRLGAAMGKSLKESCPTHRKEYK